MTPDPTALRWLTEMAEIYDGSPPAWQLLSDKLAGHVAQALRESGVLITAPTVHAFAIGWTAVADALGRPVPEGFALAAAALARQILDGHIDP